MRLRFFFRRFFSSLLRPAMRAFHALARETNGAVRFVSVDVGVNEVSAPRLRRLPAVARFGAAAESLRDGSIVLEGGVEEPALRAVLASSWSVPLP